jgi:hypothetical protein
VSLHLCQGGLVISTKGNSTRWQIWPKREEWRRSHVWSKFFIPYIVCKKMKHIYTQVAEGWIMYRLYAICSGENNISLWVVSWWIRYLWFWEGADLYRQIGDVNRLYKWSTTVSWEEEISKYCWSLVLWFVWFV